MKKIKLLWSVCIAIASCLVLFASCQKESTDESVQLKRDPVKKNGLLVSRGLDTVAFVQKMHNDALDYLYSALKADETNGVEITRERVKNHLLMFVNSYDCSALEPQSTQGDKGMSSLKIQIKGAINNYLSAAFESATLTANNTDTRKIVILPSSISLSKTQRTLLSRIENTIMQSSDHQALRTNALALLASARTNKNTVTGAALINAVTMEYSAGVLVASNQHWETAIPAWQETFYRSMDPATKRIYFSWKKLYSIICADAAGTLIGFVVGGVGGAIGGGVAFSAAAIFVDVEGFIR